MAKLYSLTFLLILVLVFPTLSQNNVGIGNSSPQEKLDVTGAIRIGNTSNDNVGTIRYNPPYFEGRNDTGWIQIGGGADNDWIINGDNMYSGVSGYAGIGISTPGAKLHVVTDSILSIVGVSFEPDNGIGVLGIGNGKSPVFPGDGAGGVFIGHYGVFAFTNDSSGIGIYAENSVGGNSGTFVGNIDVQGAIKNTDAAKFGGSVAINDGLTVGDIAGSSCNPVNSASEYFGDTLPPVNGVFPYWSGASPNFDGIVTADTGECHSITKVRLETTFFDGNWPINVDIYLRNQYMGKILLSKANVFHSANTQPPPSNFIKQDTADGGYYSNWFFENITTWNGTSPTDNWFVYFLNYGADSDYMHSFRLFIDYKWGDSTSAPLYAAYGDIRATGTIYANSNHDVGDVAEFFRVDEISRKPEIGDIVSISINNPQTFNLSQTSYDPLIAGVISENPSVFLNNPEAGEPIALTGRVKVKVNMEGGKIKPGDPITSSSEVGVGMKANQSSMILGHALEFYDGGTKSENGKVWILLAKGHFEKIDPRVQIVQGTDVELGGIEIKGAKRVKMDEQQVFVAWTEKSNVKMPDDVEFDDLVIDITAFGSKADLNVIEVNNEGFTVNVSNSADGFKGFYYKVNLVSAKFYEMNASLQEDQLKTQSSPELFAQKMAMCEQLEQLTGQSLRVIPKGLNLREIGKYKSSVIESWRKAAPELYTKFESIPETSR